MNYEQLFTQLNEENSAPKTRDEIISFLQHCSRDLKTSRNHTADIAYSIAGLMATDYAKALPNDDPIVSIFTIAGELEIDPEDKKVLKDELITSIDQLTRTAE